LIIKCRRNTHPRATAHSPLSPTAASPISSRRSSRGQHSPIATSASSSIPGHELRSTLRSPGAFLASAATAALVTPCSPYSSTLANSGRPRAHSSATSLTPAAPTSVQLYSPSSLSSRHPRATALTPSSLIRLHIVRSSDSSSAHSSPMAAIVLSSALNAPARSSTRSAPPIALSTCASTFPLASIAPVTSSSSTCALSFFFFAVVALAVGVAVAVPVSTQHSAAHERSAESHNERALCNTNRFSLRQLRSNCTRHVPVILPASATKREQSSGLASATAASCASSMAALNSITVNCWWCFCMPETNESIGAAVPQAISVSDDGNEVPFCSAS